MGCGQPRRGGPARCPHGPQGARVGPKDPSTNPPVPREDEVPRRIQLSRRKGWRLPVGAIHVARPSRWGNPYRVAVGTAVADRQIAVSLFEAFMVSGDGRDWNLEPLRGHDLACWCPLDEPCHADVLLRLANAPVIGRRVGGN